MADETPNLTQKPQAWYQGLSRYQWWILVIASMGWMFDTMDQQFFNLGRGPAMKAVLGIDPVAEGLEKLPDDGPAEYAPAELDTLFADGILTETQKKAALNDNNGEPKESVTHKDVARVIGDDLLAGKYISLTEKEVFANDKKWTDFSGDSFDKDSIAPLIEGNVLSQENADKYLTEQASGSISRELLAARVGKQLAEAQADSAGNNATFWFIIGWAIGGLFFGYVGDALGRAKTMALTILVYAIFTGLNGLATDLLTFNILRFLTALGVGGEFAAGAALVAETMPDRSRPAALGTLQALSAVGNMMGAALAYFILPISWRWLFFVGAIPGLVAVFVFAKLKEPDKWREARTKFLEEKAAGITKKHGSYLGLLKDSKWRGRAIVGLMLGVVGVGGLWGVGFFTPELNRTIAENYSEEAKERFVSIAFFLQQFGAFLGISAYTWISLTMGRRPAFGVFFIAAFFIVSYTFLFADTIAEAYILAPLIGFVTLGPFGGFAIYFPELFPTRLRSTGVGFCYNVGRFLAALVPSFKARLKEMIMAGSISLPFLASAVGDAQLAIRYGSFLMIFIYPIGLIVLLFAPETKGQPLPED